MFCNGCGKQMSKDSPFYTCCGTRVNTGRKKKDSYRLVVLIGLVLWAMCFITACDREDKTKQDVVSDMGETQTKETLVENNETIGAEKPIEEPVEEIVVKEETDYELLVTVPVEYVVLLKEPGLRSEKISKLPPGTYMKWYGESATSGGQEFYKVILRETSQEGYVPARYCVNVEFEPVEEELTIVETDTALYTYDMMVADIEELCGKYPEWLSSRVVGVSRDLRNIYEIVLGNPDAKNHIMLQAGIHGREYMTSQLVMKMIEQYAYYYETGTYQNLTYRDIFQNTALHIVPMSNPDGVTISQLGAEALNNSYYQKKVYECYERDKKTLVYEQDSNGDMYWADYYKNPKAWKVLRNSKQISFEEYQTIWKANAAGVDLNNNFDAGWDGIQLKEYPAYGSYKGRQAVSEPETKALTEVARSEDYSCFVSYHARGQLIYYDVKGNTKENSEASSELAYLLDDWTKYGPVNTKGANNVNLGGFGDWAQLVLNKPSVTIECGKSPCPLVAEEFPAIWYRHRESWAMLALAYEGKLNVEE